MRNTLFPEIVKQMQLHNENLHDIAIVINQTHTSQVSRRLSGKVVWTYKDVIALCEHYKMKPKELFREEER